VLRRLAPYPASAKAVKADPWDGKAWRCVPVCWLGSCSEIHKMRKSMGKLVKISGKI